jgi:hypothetical protein
MTSRDPTDGYLKGHGLSCKRVPYREAGRLRKPRSNAVRRSGMAPVRRGLGFQERQYRTGVNLRMPRSALRSQFLSHVPHVQIHPQSKRQPMSPFARVAASSAE